MDHFGKALGNDPGLTGLMIKSNDDVVEGLAAGPESETIELRF